MKIISCLCFITLLFISCNKKSENTPDKEKPTTKIFIKEQINEFIAPTIDGKSINTKDYNGKWWVIYIFNNNYLTKNQANYEIAPELIKEYTDFRTNFSFLAIIEGDVKNEKEFVSLAQQKKFPFPVINNTSSFSTGKSAKLHHSILCNPVKIIINPEGKLIYTRCGGNTETLQYKLDSIQHTPGFQTHKK